MLPGKERLLEVLNKHLRFVPGFSIGIINGDDYYFYSAGETISGSKQNVGIDTGFSISSLTKVVTALLTIKLFDEGRLDLFRSVYDYLPDFTFRNHAHGDEVTLFHLLTHTSGMAAIFPNFYISDDSSLEQHVYQEVSQVKMINNNNRIFNYSSANYNLLGYICERVTGLSFDQLIKQFTCKVQMEKTVFNLETAYSLNNFASGHMVNMKLFTPTPKIAFVPSYHPSTQLISNVRDLANIAHILLNEGNLNGERLISQYLWKEMLTPKVSMYSERGDFFGMGLGFKGKHADRVVHEGIGLGYFSRLYLRPEKRSGVILLANSQLYGHTSKITHLIIDEMLEDNKRVFIPQPPCVYTDNTDIRKISFSDSYYSMSGKPSKIEITKEQNQLTLLYTDLSSGVCTKSEIRQKQLGLAVIISNECKKIGFVGQKDDDHIIETVIIGNTLYTATAQWAATYCPDRFVGTFVGFLETSEQLETIYITLTSESELILKSYEKSYKLFSLQNDNKSFSCGIGHIEFYKADNVVNGFSLNYCLRFIKVNDDFIPCSE
ncbi:serine hydrolase domain-containing protein [Paenibacillus agilis]|nr:serine hydrolase domain-containing protein [Paenibacillus agilis]